MPQPGKARHAVYSAYGLKAQFARLENSEGAKYRLDIPPLLLIKKAFCSVGTTICRNGP